MKMKMKMNVLFTLVMLLWGPTVNPAEIDPNLEGEATKILTCTMPIARTDGTLLAVDEIAEIQFYVSVDTEPLVWEPAGDSQVLCAVEIDFTDVPDGLYYYTADALDTEGRRSVKSPTPMDMMVKRLANPAPPSDLGWQ